MNVNWIKGEIDPPETGEYYVIFQFDKATFPIDYIIIDTDYYDSEKKRMEGTWKESCLLRGYSLGRCFKTEYPRKLVR